MYQSTNTDQKLTLGQTCASNKTIYSIKRYILLCINKNEAFREYVGSLTRTYSFFVPRLVSAVVTVKSFMIVTYISLITGLAHLLGTVFAAVTSVRQKADPGWTRGWALGALTGPFTVSKTVIRVQLCGHKR